MTYSFLNSKLILSVSLSTLFSMNNLFADDSCRKANEFKTITDLGKVVVSLGKNEIVKNNEFDFEFSAKEILESGKVLYSSSFEDEQVNQDVKNIFKGMKILEDFNPKNSYVSFSKTAYFIPKASIKSFKDLVGNKEYIEKTLKGVKHEVAKKGGVRTRKEIPLFADATIEMSTNFETSDDGKTAVSTSKLIDKDNNTQFMSHAYSQTQYQEIEGKGVLLTTYNVGIMDKNEIGWMKKTAISAAHKTGADEKQFKEETLYMVEKNKNWFESK